MSSTSTALQLEVAQVHPLARGIQRFELRAPDGGDLPPFTAGSHLSVRTPSKDLRHYSLCNDPAERHRYVLAIKREEAGRGGSRSLVDGLRQGDRVEVGLPRNDFELDPRARSLLLIAGGIGITPLMSMAWQLLAEGRAFDMLVLTRDAQCTPFLDELRQEPLAGHVRIHHDGGDPSRALDLWPLLEKPGHMAGRHLYCCGPAPLMQAVRDMTGHWSTSAVHFESFGVQDSQRGDDIAFEIRLARSGERLAVPAGRSILQVLRDHGVRVPSSCESGTCGSCRTGLLEGQADHRDLVLREDERERELMVCVSRACSPQLVLDL